MFGNPWSVICDGQDDSSLSAGCRDVDLRLFACVAEGVSQDVGYGALCESGVGFDGEVVWQGHRYGSIVAFLGAGVIDEVSEGEGFNVELGA